MSVTAVHEAMHERASADKEQRQELENVWPVTGGDEYFPKGTNLRVHSQERLDEIARQLSQRPRKTLGFKTPAERLAAWVATTV